MVTPRRYGPHRPEDAPTHLLDLVHGRGEVEVPLHPALVEQRRRINTLAHAAGYAASVLSLVLVPVLLLVKGTAA